MSTTRKNHQTGTMITVISERDAGLDADMKWWTICEDHDRLVGHYTKADAISMAASPLTWCEVCNGNEPGDAKVGGKCFSCGGKLLDDGTGESVVCGDCGDEWPL